MPAVPYIEQTVQLVTAALRADLAARVEALNDQLLLQGDDRVLAPDAGRIYPGGADPIPSYPAIELAIPDFALEGFSLGQVDADATEQLVIAIHYQSASYERLYVSTLRLAWAAIQVVTAEDVLPKRSFDRIRGIYDASNPETGERNEFIARFVMVSTLVGPETLLV